MSYYPGVPLDADTLIDRQPKVLRYHTNLGNWMLEIDLSDITHLNYDVLPGGHRLYPKYTMSRGLITRTDYFMDEEYSDLALSVERDYRYEGVKLARRITTRRYYGEDNQPVRTVTGAPKIYAIEAPELRRRRNVVNALKQVVGGLLVMVAGKTPKDADAEGTAFLGLGEVSRSFGSYLEVGLRNFRGADGTPLRSVTHTPEQRDAVDVLLDDTQVLSASPWLSLGVPEGALLALGLSLSNLPTNPTIKDVIIRELLEPWCPSMASLTLV